jgi:hypothetical protein
VGALRGAGGARPRRRVSWGALASRPAQRRGRRDGATAGPGGGASGWAVREGAPAQEGERGERMENGFFLFNLFSNLCFSSSPSPKCMFHKFTQQTKEMHGPA